MMNKKAMVEERIQRLNPLVEAKGFALEYAQKVTNHTTLEGIRIWKKDQKPISVGAVIYYNDSLFSLSDEDLARELMREGKYIPEMPLQILEDSQYLLDHVRPMILGMENQEAMEEAPYYMVKRDPFLILFYVPITVREGEEGHVKLTKELVKSHRIFEEELLEYAFEHAEEDLQVRSMPELLSEMLGEPLPVEEGNMPMYVVTNKESCFGAVGILLPKTYERLSKILGSAFVVLPSSLHECICVPYTDEKEVYRAMVEEVNATQVELTDQLSNHVYLRNKDGIHILA